MHPMPALSNLRALVAMLGVGAALPALTATPAHAAPLCAPGMPVFVTNDIHFVDLSGCPLFIVGGPFNKTIETGAGPQVVWAGSLAKDIETGDGDDHVFMFTNQLYEDPGPIKDISTLPLVDLGTGDDDYDGYHDPGVKVRGGKGNDTIWSHVDPKPVTKALGLYGEDGDDEIIIEDGSDAYGGAGRDTLSALGSKGCGPGLFAEPVPWGNALLDPCLVMEGGPGNDVFDTTKASSTKAGRPVAVLVGQEGDDTFRTAQPKTVPYRRDYIDEMPIGSDVKWGTRDAAAVNPFVDAVNRPNLTTGIENLTHPN
ncbi:MAG: hypothetical protein JWM47_3317 [Acidimicrobiales bacterium]|nr:hypothetical protein [Acidimicrobiales bacterium]